LGEAGGCQC
jgi:hypothetical protein